MTLRYRPARLWSIFHIALLLVILVPEIPTFAQDFTTVAPQVLLLDQDGGAIASGKPLFSGQTLAPGQFAERVILARNESVKPAQLQVTARAATGGDSALWNGLQARLRDVDSNAVLYQGPLRSLASGPAVLLAPSKATRLAIAVGLPTRPAYRRPIEDLSAGRTGRQAGLPEQLDLSMFGEPVAVDFLFSITP